MQHAARRLARASTCRSSAASSPRTGRPTCCSATPRRRRAAGSAASSPAPAARRTCRACWRRRPPLPVLGVPVPSQAPPGPRLAALHRPDARRHPGGHLRHRRRRRPERGALRGGRCWRCSDPTLAQRLDQFRAGADPSRARPRAAGRARVILPGATAGRARWRTARDGCSPCGRVPWATASSCSIPIPVSPAGQVADRHLRAAYTDPARARPAGGRLRRRHHRVRERPGGGAGAARAARCRVRPPVRARSRSPRIGSPRSSFLERARLRHRAVPRGARRAPSCRRPCASVALPALLKTSRLGYDGKGQATVDRPEDALAGLRALGGVPCVLEERLALEQELSVVLARGDDGAVAAFPVGENRHRDGILETTVVPAPVCRDALADAARSIAVRGGRRPSSTWACWGSSCSSPTAAGSTSTSWRPVPTTAATTRSTPAPWTSSSSSSARSAAFPSPSRGCSRPVAMINLLGDLWRTGEPRWVEAFRRPGVRLHLYGKAEPRPGGRWVT